jgi:hypothetical protein
VKRYDELTPEEQLAFVELDRTNTRAEARAEAVRMFGVEPQILKLPVWPTKGHSFGCCGPFGTPRSALEVAREKSQSKKS